MLWVFAIDGKVTDTTSFNPQIIETLVFYHECGAARARGAPRARRGAITLPGSRSAPGARPAHRRQYVSNALRSRS